MTREENYAHAGTKKFTLVSMLKLVSLVSVFLALGTASRVPGFAFLVVASISLFLAEHFANSRRSEFFYLVGLPTIGWVLVIAVFSVPGLGVALPVNAIWEGVGAFFAVIVLTTIFSVVSSALSVVAVCILCGTFFRLTGIRLLKFDWRDKEAD